MRTAGRRYRVWWPEQLLSCTSSSGLLLFGWFMESACSFDIVVATAIPSEKISVFPLQTNLQEIFKSVDGKMPISLKASTFSVLGYCVTDLPNRKLKPLFSQNGMEDSVTQTENCKSQSQRLNHQCSIKVTTGEKVDGRWNCGCKELKELHFQSLMKYDNWILSFCQPQNMMFKRNKRIPYLHHVHQNGYLQAPAHVHIIIYEVPSHGVSHFSLSPWYSPKHVGLSNRPSWVNELHKKPLLLDLDRILLALNCSNVATILLGQMGSTSSPLIHISTSIWLRLGSIIWHMVAALVASISTSIYIFLQCLHRPLTCGSISFILPKIFVHTWNNVHIRSCQILYWPVFLQGTGISSHSNVEYSHKAALRKHFLWSNFLMDVIFGAIFGILLLANIESVSVWISVSMHQVTNDLLRSGCVWLMGVPAGFKLNNEFAEFIGMISLNAIQIFSTLCFFLGSYLQFYLWFLALLGTIFGLTAPVALSIDMLKLMTQHIYLLHFLISILYSQQIRASASLWRLFCGRKQNPLRRRLDSYDYTVEQHVVGSLLFTPLLLLIPTTSVFYIFFTSLITAIFFLRITFEIIISLLHATPFAEIFTWIMSRRKFPSGIWFRILEPNHEMFCEVSSPTCYDTRQKDKSVEGESEPLVSVLCSNYATIGQVIRPYYADIFSGVAPSFCTSLARGILSGQRFPSTFGTRLPPTMPWMQIRWKEYWNLCYAAVLSTRWQCRKPVGVGNI